MDRSRWLNTALAPVDGALGLVVGGLDRTGALDVASGLAMGGMRAALRRLFRAQNNLQIEGAENVPREGGLIFASNHQSWLDAQVLGASSPRLVHFLAKQELGEWPVLRHFIRLSGSILVQRGGGDADAMANAIAMLKHGEVLGIYPEGTIPGEEDIPRSAVDPLTRLLPGKTGVARLALAANVPIVPVGVSGTGRALPPEVYPRLERLRPPGQTPIRITFGAPILMSDYAEREVDRALFRELTDRVMNEIAVLVDHSLDYEPPDDAEAA